jgi:hypothetical protein
MTLRTFGLLMLLLASTLSGASYTLSKSRPQVVAEASVATAMAPPVDAVAEVKSTALDSSIRVILPSPYEIRSN